MVPNDSEGAFVKSGRSSLVKTLISSDKITNGISALKQISNWPEAGKQSTPKYNNDTATIYLEFRSNKVEIPSIPGPSGTVLLPHPLSYKRSVCFIAPNLEQEELRVEFTSLFEQIGIQGKVTMIPVSLVETAILDEDDDTLTYLVELFDTHLTDQSSGVPNQIKHQLQSLFYRYSKDLFDVHFQTGRVSGLQKALAKSALWVNSSRDGYELKVAHTGLTDVQIKENVQTALNYVACHQRKFPGGLKDFKSISLKTGSSDGVAIYGEKHKAETAATSKRSAPKQGASRDLGTEAKRQKVAAQKPRDRKSLDRIHDANSWGHGSEEAGSEDARSREHRSEEAGSQGHGSKKVGSWRHGSKEAQSREHRNKGAGSWRRGNEEAGSWGHGSKKVGSWGHGSKEAQSREHRSEEAGSWGHGSEEAGDWGRGSEEAGGWGHGSQGAQVKSAQEPRSQLGQWQERQERQRRRRLQLPAASEGATQS